MAASKEDIKMWLQRGRENGSTHVIVVCDTYEHDDYPVFVKTDESAKDKADVFDGKNMQKVMEVYNLSMDVDSQLAQHRALNY